jgi:AbiV family abortive infection protein
MDQGKLTQGQKERYCKAAEACSANARGLLHDAELLFGVDRFSTALAIAVLAQEEFAKAFILTLVGRETLAWV